MSVRTAIGRPFGHRHTSTPPPNLEWDSYTGGYVRAGWVAERQAIMDGEYARWVDRQASGVRGSGTCTACGHPTDDHPMPERMWRSGPDLCARVVKRATDSTTTEENDQ